MFILLYVGNRLYPAELVDMAIGILAVAALVVSFRKASGLYYFTGLAFLSVGLAISIYHQEPFYTLIFHFQSMLALLALFLLLPWMNSLIHVGHFDTQLNQLLKLRTSNLSQLYQKSSLVSHMLGVFLNIATIPLMVKSLSHSLTTFHEETVHRFYTRSILRAYALCLTWSPLEVMVSIAMDSTGVKYYEIFPVLFLLSMMLMFLNATLFSYEKNSVLPIDTADLQPSEIIRLKKKVLQLGWILVAFVVVVSLVDHLTGQGFLFSIILVILPFTIFSAWKMKKLRQYLTITIPEWKRRTVHLSNYFFMFLSAGFFVEMIARLESITKLQALFSHQMDHIFLFYLLTGAYFVITSLIGFHPLVSITLFLSLLEPLNAHLSTLSFAIVLVTCSIMTVMYSPYNLSVSLLSNELKVNPYKITKWNIGFAMSYMLLGISAAYIIHLTGW